MDDQEILKERARILADPETDRFLPAEEGKEVLGFLLSGEHYAIETNVVREAITIHEITPIPGTPSHLLGVMNVRGRIIPVVDLKQFLGMEREGIEHATRAIILERGFYEIAFIPDALLPIQWIPGTQVKPAPATLKGLGAELLLGVMEDATILVDGDQMISKLPPPEVVALKKRPSKRG